LTYTLLNIADDEARLIAKTTAASNLSPGLVAGAFFYPPSTSRAFDQGGGKRRGLIQTRLLGLIEINVLPVWPRFHCCRI